MLARTLWLWVLVWLAETTRFGHASICDHGVCSCNRGKVQCDCLRSSTKVFTLEIRMVQDYLTTTISVANCGRVHLVSRALAGLPALQQVSFTNITSLTMEEQAFSWTTDDPRHSGIAIDISHCNIPEIPSYTFRGSLRDVLLTDVNVSQTRPFAFAAIDHAEKMQFTRVRFDNIDSQAFKRFSTNLFMFIDSSFNCLRRRTMVNIEVVKEARFENVKVDRIESTAISLRGIQNFKLTKSIIKYIDKYAILLNSKGDVSINDNSFLYLKNSAFLGITVDDRHVRDTGKEDLVFENNTLLQFDSGALAFNQTGFDIRLDWLRLNQPCSCPSIHSWVSDLVIFYTNSNNVSVPLQLNTIMYCLDPRACRVIDYQSRKCEVSRSLVGTTGLVVGVTLVLTTLATVVYCAVRKTAKRYITVPGSPLSALKPAESNKPHILVVPDGKTYRETELHVIVEHVEPIVSTDYIKEETES